MPNQYHNTLVEQETMLNNIVAQSPFGSFFGISQKVFDSVWANFTAKGGNSAIYVSMEIGADLDVFDSVKSYLLQNEITDIITCQ